MHIVRVRLRKPRRVLSYLSPDSLALQRDDSCIVQGEHGPEWGVCILPPEPCPPECESRYTYQVLRRVNAGDEETMTAIVREEQKAFKICLEKIQNRKLPMKLVDAEFSFDQRKVVFYFTADDRVDFRELVRDLAHELRNRIELRHIQVRDEARLVGGLGCCGRQLCCASWLGEFKPISMRMAKRQNLSLNPSKISGQCGRLLCCLAYENDQYDTRKKPKAPAPEEKAVEEEIPEELEELEDEEAENAAWSQRSGDAPERGAEAEEDEAMGEEGEDEGEGEGEASDSDSGESGPAKKGGRSRRRGRRRRNKGPRNEAS